jgi:hypothetical protein
MRMATTDSTATTYKAYMSLPSGQEQRNFGPISMPDGVYIPRIASLVVRTPFAIAPWKAYERRRALISAANAAG